MNSKGFTLIELVVVIVILGILAAVAIPRYIDFAGDANEAVAEANVGAIRTAVAMAYAENALNGNAVFPSDITGNLFNDGQVPEFPDGYGYSYNSTTGVVTLTTP
jgi:MSHA pilin protein MshA